MQKIGASFSIPYARDLDLDWKTVFLDAAHTLGLRRWRLMSYWHLVEPLPDVWNWGELDWQMDGVAKIGGEVNLCVGWRQPRYPECHAPSWAKDLSIPERNARILHLVESTARRYRDHPALRSWHLENEALNRGFGECDDFSRRRLRRELSVLKHIDRKHPVVMSLSNTWGLPLRRPRPDLYAISIYLRQHSNGGYTNVKMGPEWQRLRKKLTQFITGRQTFIHELQAEPWGPTGTQMLSSDEQDKSMNPEQFCKALNYALSTGMMPIDLWGLEWWYWRRERWGDSAMWDTVKNAIAACARL